MNTLTVQRQGAVIGVRQGTLHITLHGEPIATYPLELVQEVLIHGGVSVTTPALRALLEQRAALHVLTRAGRYLGSLSAGLNGHPDLIRAQVQAQTPETQLAQARAIVHAKLHHTALLVRRYQRRTPADHWRVALEEQLHAQRTLADATSLNEINGIEGHAAAWYFKALTEHLDPAWGFTGRARRPPPDPANLLLSLGYTLLGHHVLTDVQRTGLHPGFGFLHQPHGRRPVLSLDLMEPHRAPLVDRTVLSCVNRHLLAPSDFEWQGSLPGLTPKAREVFLREYSRALDRPLSGSLTYREFITKGVRRYAEAIRTGVIYQPQLLK